MKLIGPDDVLSGAWRGGEGLKDIRREFVRVLVEDSALTFYDVSIASLLLRSAGKVSSDVFLLPPSFTTSIYILSLF